MLSHLQTIFAEHADRNAFCIDDRFFTYRELADEVGNMRVALRQCHETHIGLVANDDIYTYASILALWMEGKSYVPLHPLQPIKRCEDIISQVGIRTVIDSSETTRYHHVDVIRPQSVDHHPESFYDETSYDCSRMAYILFTSGSTGRPKGVCITMGNVAAFMDAFFALGIQLYPDDRCLQMFDLTFDMSVGSYLAPLLRGACVYTVAPGKIKWQEVYRLMDEYELTEAQLVPSVIHYLKPYFDEISAPSMRYALFAGEGLPADDVAGWQRCLPNAEVWNVYGPTENTVYSTGYLIPRHVPVEEHNGIVGIGQAMRRVKTMVVDEQGRRLPTGIKGELCLAGPQLTPGYWHNEAKNREAFFDFAGERWYHTGDICQLQSNGNLLYLGRKDSQVQIQGYRVELSEIEHVARGFYGEQVAAVALAEGNGSDNTTIGLAVETRNREDDQPLLEHLRQFLPQYMLPTSIYHIQPFPQNASNKIDRRKIKELIALN
ncbi:MAG: AMP-binding protein [Prevotella sp.]|nr:AMP-binding protein [Prevotella sp.]